MNVGLGELLLLMMLTLIVLGPEKLPEAGAALGRALSEFRRASAEITGAFLGDGVAQGSPPPAPSSAPRPCAACGAFIAIQHVFCPTCGTDQRAAARPHENGRPEVPAEAAAQEPSQPPEEAAGALAAETASPAPPAGVLALQSPPAEEAVPFAPEAPAQHGTSPARAEVGDGKPEGGTSSQAPPARTADRPPS